MIQWSWARCEKKQRPTTEPTEVEIPRLRQRFMQSNRNRLTLLQLQLDLMRALKLQKCQGADEPPAARALAEVSRAMRSTSISYAASQCGLNEPARNSGSGTRHSLALAKSLVIPLMHSKRLSRIDKLIHVDPTAATAVFSRVALDKFSS